ncbi:MAG: peptide-methionine (S)-S-oxide reductase MsrA [Candidatus Kaiserbacteria bacterium]|nr:peptide-methionine (S)-S-oxide reductase MsrA [Candidatus Kaiserbacteria bacterium]
MEQAIFAAGCFWGVEQAFMNLPGVTNTRVGYIGGTTENPTYEAVCGGGTGHKEAVAVSFDPKKISYDDLLRVFWEIHDPTSWDRQGADHGEQYRSVIFYTNKEQKEKAEQAKQERDESGMFDSPIVTEILPAATFCEAEEYHQKYLQKNNKTCGA